MTARLARCRQPVVAKDLLAEFWKLDAEKMLGGLAE